MNIKDRLKNRNTENNISAKENSYQDNSLNITDIFVNAENVINIICDCVSRNKNIILSGDKSIDKQIAVNYIRLILNNGNDVFINKAEEVLLNPDPKIYIMPKPSIKEIVKIFEYIICGYKSFIFGLDLNNRDNVIEKLKVLAAVNFPNMTEDNINTLLSESDSVFVFISRNEDGLYCINLIEELIYSQGKFDFNVLFNSEDEQNGINGVKLPFDNEEKDVNTPQETQTEILEENTEVKTVEFVEDTEELIKEETAEEQKAEEIQEGQEISEAAEVQKGEEIQEGQEVSEAAEVQKAEEVQEGQEMPEIKDLQEVQEEEKSEELQQTPVKINKYKLLKEKIKNKRSI